MCKTKSEAEANEYPTTINVLKCRTGTSTSTGTVYVVLYCRIVPTADKVLVTLAFTAHCSLPHNFLPLLTSWQCHVLAQEERCPE